MKRREALKNIGISLGYTAVAPSAISLLQSCTSTPRTWNPQFLTQDQGIVIKNLIDLILPKTKASPGAVEVNIPEFIDLIALKVYQPKAQKAFKKTLSAIANELIAKKNTEFKVANLELSEYDSLLAKYLKANQKERNGFDEVEKTIHKGLVDLRAKAVWAFKNAEAIGENVLAYNPIPGYYANCVDLNETTNGKAWSLQS